MSYCTQCNAELTDNAKFCPNCGTPVPKSASLDIKQKVGTAKGNVTGLVTGKGSSTDNLNAAVGQTVDTVESGGVVTGAVLGGEGGNIHLGGQQQYGDTVQGEKNVVDTGGGAFIRGSVSTAGGDFVGRDKVIHGDEVRGDKITTGNVYGQGIAIGRNSQANVNQGLNGSDLDRLFMPLMTVVHSAPEEKRSQALQKADDLKTELAKGDKADDACVARLIDGLIGLVPDAVKTVTDIFATSILSGLAGSTTKFVLDKIQGK